MRKQNLLEKAGKMSDPVAVVIVISAAMLLSYSIRHLDPAWIISILVDAYALFAAVILIIKLAQWLRKLNRFLRRHIPLYDRVMEDYALTVKGKERTTRIIYVTLRALTIISAVGRFIEKDYTSFILALFTLLLFTLPDIIQRRGHIRLPSTLESVIYCFIFAAEVLGEINNFYGLIPGWDTMLHTINGFLCGAIGFAMVDMLNRRSVNLNLSPVYLAIMAFCFSMTIGILWEFIEFIGDQLFIVDMQKDTMVSGIKSILLNPTGANVPVVLENITETTVMYGSGEQFVISGGYLDIGIIDTMKDLFVNFIGAVLFSIIGYLYVRQRDKNRPGFASRFIPVVEPVIEPVVEKKEET